MPLGQRGRVIIASIAVVAVVAVSAGTYALTRSGGKSEAERERSGSHEMREALEKHPALGDHRLPLAFVVREAGAERRRGQRRDQERALAGVLRPARPAPQDDLLRPAEGRGTRLRQGPEPVRDRRGSCGAAQGRGRRARRGRPDLDLGGPRRRHPGRGGHLHGHPRVRLWSHHRRCCPERPAGRAAATCTPAPPAVVSGRPATRWRRTRPGPTSAPASRRPRSAPSTGRRTAAASTSAPVSPTDPRTPRPASASTSPPTGPGPSARCRPSPTARTSRSTGRSLRSRWTRNNARHILVGTAVARHGSSSVNGGRFTPPGAAKVGLYETRNGGATWQLTLSQDSDEVDPSSPTGADFFRGGISKIKFDPTHRGMAYVVDVRLRPVPRGRERELAADLHDQDPG